MNPLKVIRAKCIDCSGGSVAEVKECPLHPYRMGTNPFRAKRTPEQRAAAAERFRAVQDRRRAGTIMPVDENRAKSDSGASGRTVLGKGTPNG